MSLTRLEEYRIQKEKERRRLENRGKRMAAAAIIFMAVVVVGGFLYYMFFVGAWSYYNGGPDCVLEQEVKKDFELVSTRSHVAKSYKNLSLICDKSSISAYNSKGECKWSINISVGEPILDVCENYILVADRKGKNIYIIKNGKTVLEYASDYNISNARVNKNGSFITVTEEDKFKSRVSLRSVSGEELFTWHSASSYVIDAAVSSDENTVMLTTLTTNVMTDGTRQYSSGVRVFDADEAKEISSIEYKDSLAAIVFYAKKGFVVVSDGAIVKYNDKGEETNRYAINGKCGKIAYDAPNIAAVYIDENYNNHLVILDENLSLISSRDFESRTIDAIDMQSGVVSYVIDNEIYMCKQNLDVRYRVKTALRYDEIKLFARGKRVYAANDADAAILVTK